MSRHRRSRRGAAVLPVVAAVLSIAACTAAPSSTRSSVPTASDPPTRSSSSPPAPVSSGPTRTVRASSCPFVKQDYVHMTIGERLGRITAQRSGGRVVGCRFYALQTGTYHRSETLPGPHQPSVEITTTRWPTTTDAYNAFVLRARRGANGTRADLGGTRVGVCFQDDFYRKDHGLDWACAASTGKTEVVVRSVDTTSQNNTIAVTKKVLDALEA